MLPVFLFRMRFVIVVIISLILLLTGCSKSGGISAIPQTVLQQFFEQNILNRDYKVKLATDTGVDLTPRYNGYIFRLLKNTSFDGALTATKGPAIYNGTWSSNDDYSKLVITLPTLPVEFVFLNREWKFTKKDIPVMELAPWGTTDPKVLQMERL